jgi:TolB-like protein/Flp pilus assembly protein TadD
MSSAAANAVFLSYASQDADAARKICEALRAAQVEVWFDQSELVGGDTWDAKIRGQIASCALFVPVISANTQARREGYFRIEWRLAAQRTHGMSDDTAFLLPVVIDDTRDAEAKVPAEFRAVQWTRLRPSMRDDGGPLRQAHGGQARDDASVAAFCEQVQRLLGGDVAPAGLASEGLAKGTGRALVQRTGLQSPTAAPSRRHPLATAKWSLAAAAVVAVAAIVVWRPWQKSPAAATSPAVAAPPALSEARKFVAQARKLLDEGDDTNRENYVLAEDWLKRAAGLDSGDGEVWAAWSQLSADLYRFGLDRAPARREALRTQTERAARLAPDSVETQIALAGAADYLGLDQSATEPSLRAAAHRASNNWRVLMALGRKLGRAGKVDEAVEVLARADQLAGTNPMPWVDASSYFLAAGRFDEAEAAVAKSLSRRTSVRALVFDGILKLCWRGDVPAATAAVERWPAWSLLEDRGGSIAGLVWLWARQPEKALAVYQRLPRDYLRDSFFTGPRAALTAFAHLQAGHREAAAADWQLALQVAERELAAAPGDNYALYWKAWSASQLGDRATAESIIQMLEQRDWTTPSFHSPEAKRAGLLLALARPDDSLAFLQTTLERESRDRRVEFKNQFVNYRLTRAVLALNPLFDAWRSDARFLRLLEQAPAVAAPVAPMAGAPKADLKSVAILPFSNLSTEKDNALFAEGVHDDVITNLQKIRDLKVISRTSVLAYRDASARNLAKIADELGVATIVEATVRRVGNQVRVNARLIVARTEASLWADSLDGDASDLFGLEATMAQKIAAALQARLTEGERTLIERRPTKNPVAYELFLKARRLHDVLNNRSSRQEHEAAIAAYARVLKEDSEFALVYSRLTHVHGHMYWLGHLDPTSARRALAETSLREAIRIDPGAPETEYARGLVAYYCEMNWARALAHYQKAELGLPNDPALQGQLGFTHRRLGNWQDCLRHFERAVELEPRYLYLASELSASLLDHRRDEAARTLAERFATLYPDDAMVAHTRARAEFALTGDRKAFLNALERLPRAGQDPTGLRAAYERAMWAQDFAAAERILADPALGTVIDSMSIIAAPAALHRALVAFLQGKADDARKFSVAAMADYSRRTWTPRQEPFVAMDVAAAKAYSGRADEAVSETKAAVASIERLDANAGTLARSSAGRLFAVIGRKEDALAILRSMMSGPSRLTPVEIRHDPCWSRLKDDPRFEEILAAAKPL